VSGAPPELDVARPGDLPAGEDRSKRAVSNPRAAAWAVGHRILIMSSWQGRVGEVTDRFLENGSPSLFILAVSILVTARSRLTRRRTSASSEPRSDGRISSMGCPIAFPLAVAEHPRRASVPPVMMPSRVLAIMASSDDSIIAASRRAAASARVATVSLRQRHALALALRDQRAMLRADPRDDAIGGHVCPKPIRSMLAETMRTPTSMRPFPALRRLLVSGLAPGPRWTPKTGQSWTSEKRPVR
jgi:hypothetical protein